MNSTSLWSRRVDYTRLDRTARAPRASGPCSSCPCSPDRGAARARRSSRARWRGARRRLSRARAPRPPAPISFRPAARRARGQSQIPAPIGSCNDRIARRRGYTGFGSRAAPRRCRACAEVIVAGAAWARRGRARRGRRARRSATTRAAARGEPNAESPAGEKSTSERCERRPRSACSGSATCSQSSRSAVPPPRGGVTKRMRGWPGSSRSRTSGRATTL